jgi:hypothetical protein
MSDPSNTGAKIVADGHRRLARAAQSRKSAETVRRYREEMKTASLRRKLWLWLAIAAEAAPWLDHAPPTESLHLVRAAPPPPHPACRSR